jgi:23S rRNA (adenine2503-C2)-methyltransferase
MSELLSLEQPGTTTRRRLLGMTRAELARWLGELGEPAYRGGQLARWLYARGAADFAAMTDLPAALRTRLAQVARVGRAEVAARRAARDGTVKLLLRLEDRREIETVMLPYPDRTAVCISSQVGCPVGCTFCATAMMGFTRNLDAGEMIDQVLAARAVAPERAGPRVTHVVVMGMGEPLLNLEATLAAVRLLRAELELSPRHVTISTAGYVPGIRRLAEARLPVTLALSLHAPTDDLRARLIPLSQKYGLPEVMAAVRDYTRITRRRVTLEYLLLAGVNDRAEQAGQLARLVQGMINHVNLIPWNPATSRDAFQAPRAAAVHAFRQELERHGLNVTQRVERGRDIEAACGQLVVTGTGRASPTGGCS